MKTSLLKHFLRKKYFSQKKEQLQVITVNKKNKYINKRSNINKSVDKIASRYRQILNRTIPKQQEIKMDSLNYRHAPYGSAKIRVLLISLTSFKKLSAMRTSQHPCLLYKKPPSSFNLRNRTQWYDGMNTKFFNIFNINIVENRLKCQLVLPFTEPLALAVQNPPMPPVPAKNQLIMPPDIPIDALSDQKPRPRRPTPDPKKSTASLLEKFEQALKEHYHKRKSDEVVTAINEKITAYLKEIIKHPNQSDKQGNTALVISALYAHPGAVRTLLSTPRINSDQKRKDGKNALALSFDSYKSLENEDTNIGKDIIDVLTEIYANAVINKYPINDNKLDRLMKPAIKTTQMQRAMVQIGNKKSNRSKFVSHSSSYFAFAQSRAPKEKPPELKSKRYLNYLAKQEMAAFLKQSEEERAHERLNIFKKIKTQQDTVPQQHSFEVSYPLE